MGYWSRRHGADYINGLLILGIMAAVIAVIVWAFHSQIWGLAPCYDRAFIIDDQCNDYRQRLERDGWHWVCRCRED
jgi:hypothetical protein